MTTPTALERVAQLHEVFAGFAASGLSIAAARAVLFIGMASSDYESPLLPSVSDVATALEMSPSGASRLLSGLTGEDDPVIASDKGIKDSRSESFFLTAKGQSIVEEALLLLYREEPDSRITPLDVSSYARAKYIDKKGNSGIRLESWIGSEVRYITKVNFTPHDNDLVQINEVSKPTLEEHKTQTFQNRSQAMLFMCKKCLPFRRSPPK